MVLDNPLWHYAVALYGRPGVSEAALALQGAGASVNELLLACYLARQGHVLEVAQLPAAAIQWQGAISHPLRALRYRLREQRAEYPQAESCYRHLRAAELACEQLELALLWEGMAQLQQQRATPGAALARRNLQAVLAGAGIDGAEWDRDLSCIIAAAFPPD